MYKHNGIKDGITNVLIGMIGVGLDSRHHSSASGSQYHDAIIFS
jgi:hypothetical protein